MPDKKQTSSDTVSNVHGKQSWLIKSREQ